MNCTVIELDTKKSIAKVCGVQPATIDTWRKKLDMPFVEITGDKRPAVRFDREKVISWAKKHEKLGKSGKVHKMRKGKASKRKAG